MKPSREAESEGSSSAENLVGKINNLVTTDLENIGDARDFLLVLLYIPLQVLFCILFLYIVLGWRCVPDLPSFGHPILISGSS